MRLPSSRELKKIRDVRQFPVCRVTWVDSCSCSRWRDVDQVRGETLMECQTVGFLVSRTRRSLVLAQSVNENRDLAASWVVPTAGVKRVERLR